MSNCVNERIRELAEQARIQYEQGGAKIQEPGQYYHEDVVSKFAELIVRECMAMCKTAVGNADYNTGRLHCLNNIKEHFGVEE